MATRPNLEQLKKQAREFLDQLGRGETAACQRLSAHHPKFAGAGGPPLAPAPVLADVQLVLAREHDFPSWPRLKRFVEDLESVDQEAATLRQAWLRGDEAVRQKVRQAKEPYFKRDRFEKPDTDAEFTDHDAHAVVAMDHGYARWDKYESFLHLDPNVRDVIAAIKQGDLNAVAAILAADPAAAQPHWVGAYRAETLMRERGANKSGFEPGSDAKVANDSVPLFIVSEALFNGSNSQGNEYELSKALLKAGADPEIANHLPMTGACSFNNLGGVRALLKAGAAVDGPGGHGINLCYALYFGFSELSQYLAARGAKVDLRFAAGLGQLDTVRGYFNTDGSLKSGVGDLADPYRTEADRPHNAPRSPELILQQALMFACLHGHLEAAAFLLAQGADPSALVTGLDVNSTAMHRLAWIDTYGAQDSRRDRESQRLPAVKFLLEHGYDRTATDAQHGATALNWAEHAGAEQIAALLRADT